MLYEQRQINRDSCSDAAFPTPTPCHSPEFSDPLGRNVTISGNGREGLTLRRIKRSTKRGFQNGKPRPPSVELVETSAEHAVIKQRLIDLNHRRPRSRPRRAADAQATGRLASD